VLNQLQRVRAKVSEEVVTVRFRNDLGNLKEENQDHQSIGVKKLYLSGVVIVYQRETNHEVVVMIRVRGQEVV